MVSRATMTLILCAFKHKLFFLLIFELNCYLKCINTYIYGQGFDCFRAMNIENLNLNIKTAILSLHYLHFAYYKTKISV